MVEAGAVKKKNQCDKLKTQSDRPQFRLCRRGEPDLVDPGNKNRGLWAYFILTYAIMLLTWGVMAVFRIHGASAASGAGKPALGGLVLFFLGGFSPSIAGIFMTWRIGGRDGLRDLWRRATWIDFGWRWYRSLLLIPLLILGLRVGIQLARGGAFVESPLMMKPLHLIGFTIAIILGGPVSEEFGWRGFALDRLLRKWNVVTADLILGIAWAFWHLPLFFIPGTIQQLNGKPSVEFPIFALLVMGLTVFFDWLYIHSDRSVFAVILVHMVFN